MAKRPQDDSYTEAEAEQRFLEALKSGLKTEPKPLKEKPKTRKKGTRRNRPLAEAK
jgi:hypothetical protein